MRQRKGEKEREERLTKDGSVSFGREADRNDCFLSVSLSAEVSPVLVISSPSLNLFTSLFWQFYFHVFSLSPFKNFSRLSLQKYSRLLSLSLTSQSILGASLSSHPSSPRHLKICDVLSLSLTFD